MVTSEELRMFLEYHKSFECYIDGTPLTKEMLSIDGDRINISKCNANIGKKCLFKWHGEWQEGTITNYALGCYLIHALDTIVAMPPSECFIIENGN